MRAYELRSPGTVDGLVLNPDRADPSAGHGEILVRMRAAALNYRDILVRAGRYRGGLAANLVPLSDGAGEVVAVGEGVSAFKPGDRVAGAFFPLWTGGAVNAEATALALGGSAHGVLAEYAVLSAAGAVALPGHLSFQEGATLPCAAVTAWNAVVETAATRAGDTVLLLGTGGVSLFALQFARLSGARVLIASSSDAKLERARALGADGLINYRSTPDWDQEVLRLTGGRGVDLVVEVGGAGTLERSLRSVRVGGTVALIGVLTGGGTIDPRPLLGKSIRLQGIFVGSREMFSAMNRAIAAHALRPVIDCVLSFAAALEAYDHLAAGRHFGKVVIGID